MDETRASFMRNIYNVFNKLAEGDQHLMHYRWYETGYFEPRMKMSIISYFKPWKLIIGANIYYTDFKSYEIEQQLKYNLKHKMADQRIGEDGYIWVINSKGEYVVSKDLLRDGENIYDARGPKGRLITQEVISIAKKLKPEETAIYYYSWRNLGDPQTYEKLAAITYIPEWDWILGASAYHKDFLQGLDVIKANIIRVCIAAIFIGSLIAYFSALFISKPIKQLEKISMQASKGDLSAVIDPKIISHKDEIGSLAQSFNTMMINLKDLLKQQKETYREMAEAKELAESANAAKSDFLARMSHEIRSPLNVVIGLTYIILKSDLSTEQRDYISKVQIASNNLLEVINDILDFSKVEAGRLDLTNAPFDLNQVMDQLADLFSNRTAQKDLELIIAVSPEVPGMLIGDANRLTQILTNLIENAVKFTDEGEIAVEIKLDDQAPRNDTQTILKFEICDTGVGIAEDAMPTLFDPFTQADRYLTRDHEGTGLGLAICRRLVQLMGGSIEVKSTPGQGSTFYFSIAFAVQEEKSRRYHMPLELHGLKALVVDDNAIARQVLEDRLKSFTFNVSSVDSGDKAIEALREAAGGRPYQLVVKSPPFRAGHKTSWQGLVPLPTSLF